MQSSSQSVTTSKPAPNYLQARCPSCLLTNSITALKELFLKVFGSCFSRQFLILIWFFRFGIGEQNWGSSHLRTWYVAHKTVCSSSAISETASHLETFSGKHSNLCCLLGIFTQCRLCLHLADIFQVDLG